MSLRLVVLGLSTFTRSLIEYAHANGDVEIIAVDSNEERLSPILSLIDRPYVGDVSDLELLRKIAVDTADRVIISLPSIETSLLCLLNLRELNARCITVRAASDEHVKLLRLLGVHEIIFPEKQMAEIYGLHLLNEAFSWVRPVTSGLLMAVLTWPENCAVAEETTVAEMEQKLDVQILGIVRPEQATAIRPTGEERLLAGDEVMIVGAGDSLTKFARSTAPRGSHGRLVPWTWRALTGRDS